MDYPDRVILVPGTGDEDPWSSAASTDPYKSLRCRIAYTGRVVKNQEGQEVVSNVHIRFPNFTPVSYGDELTWTDLSGEKRTARPIQIRIPRDLSGQPLMTVHLGVR